MTTKAFKPWTEEERRANIRAKTLAFKARKDKRTSDIMKYELAREIDRKKMLDAGEWIIAEPKIVVKPQIAPDAPKKKQAKKGFAILDDLSDSGDEMGHISDHEVAIVEKVPWTRAKMCWADEMDEE